MERKYLTPEGFEKFKKELEYLKTVKRKEIAERLKETVSLGDLTENAAYQETKEAQSFLEGRILELEELIRKAVIISNKKSDKVGIGSTVLVEFGQERKKFKIVDSSEADPSSGKISYDSPLGKAFFNRKKDETFELETPEGKIKSKILKID